MDDMPDSTRVFVAHPDVARADRFLNPFTVAEAAGLHVIIARLPAACTELTDGETILVADHEDTRELGGRVFRGIAKACLERCYGAHSNQQVLRLAARLAAPPRLLHNVGIDRAVQLQRWAPEHFLRAWWSALQSV